MVSFIDPSFILEVGNKLRISHPYSVKHNIGLFKIDVTTILLCKIFVLMCLMMAGERAVTWSMHVKVQLVLK